MLNAITTWASMSLVYDIRVKSQNKVEYILGFHQLGCYRSTEMDAAQVKWHYRQPKSEA